MKTCPYCEAEHTDMGPYCSEECREAHLGKDRARVDWDVRPPDDAAPDPRGITGLPAGRARC